MKVGEVVIFGDHRFVLVARHPESGWWAQSLKHPDRFRRLLIDRHKVWLHKDSPGWFDGAGHHIDTGGQ